MKKTMYELLGMVKDGKAPKKIKYCDEIYRYASFDYISTEDVYLFDDRDFFKILNDEVEIIEEPKGIPEKLKCGKVYNNLDDRLEYHEMKIDEIIDFLEYLESKGE